MMSFPLATVILTAITAKQEWEVCSGYLLYLKAFCLPYMAVTMVFIVCDSVPEDVLKGIEGDGQ